MEPKPKDFSVFPDLPHLDDELWRITEEADHVHTMHPESWKREGRFKDMSAARLLILLGSSRSKLSRCLTPKHRVLSMLVYRAFELLDEDIAPQEILDRVTDQK